MKILTDNKNIYMIISDRLYSESLPQDVSTIDDDMKWDIQNPEIKTMEDLYAEFPWAEYEPDLIKATLIDA